MPAALIDPGSLAVAFADARSRLDRLAFADALWERRLTVWPQDAAAQASVANRLGWLGALDFIEPQIPRLRGFAERIRTGGFTRVVLLGMGGSSLAPEVLRQVLGVAQGYPEFLMLDSVDPDAVRAALDDAESSFFILASKSGTTIEPNVMAAEAQRRLLGVEGGWAARFAAITDPDTALHRRAVADGFNEVFVNPPDIGGRYSALSFFGMVPAALMGADLEAMVRDARAMEAACRVPSVDDNPGLALGALMAAGAATGRDKLTLVLPPRLASLGLWIEQLVAESTGKHGKGVVPVAGESPGAPFGEDRVAVSLSIESEAPDAEAAEPPFPAGTPVARLTMPGVTAIGAEFLRWEVATAAAGALLGINPFDEPNVQQAKDATRALLDRYRATKQLSPAEPHGSLEGARLTASQAAIDALDGRPVDEFLRCVTPGDYVGVLAYLPPDVEPFAAALQAFRSSVGARTGCATMLGYGPRYLHSTGQLHKGGANNGVFVVVTAPPATDLAIPGEPFSFGVLEMAQALGDFQSLDRTGRRALHLHLPERSVDAFQRVVDALLK